MSDPDADADEVVAAATDADPADAEHEDADETEQPDAADLPAPDLSDAPDPEEVEADAGADGVGGETDEDATSDADESGEADESSGSGTPTMGDLYVQSLVAVTNALIEEHGDPDAEKVGAEAAHQLEVGEHFDRLVDKHGMGREMSPEQAVVLSSAMFVGSNVLAKTDVAGQLAGEVEL
jgi:hypothetical protein